MGEGDLKELRELVEFLKATGVAEFDMERPELKVRLKFASSAEANATAGTTALDLAALARLVNSGATVPTSSAAAEALSPAVATMPAESAETPLTAVDENAGLHIVKSPLVGTFYAAPSPGADEFVKVGDAVGTGKVLCIVEAMKIMNEIESDAAGEVARVFVKPGQPVEYGQPLFAIRA